MPEKHPDPVRVLLVDDHPVVLQGIRSLITSPFTVVGAVPSAEQALEMLRTQDVEVVVTDYEMPGLSGAAFVKAVQAVQPEARIVVLSMHDDPAIVREVLQAGCSGYVLKKDPADVLLKALVAVSEGRRFFSEEIAEMLIQVPEPHQGVLTERELEILRLIAKEFSSRQIAEILFISERTVETHRKNILRKTGTTNSVGLMKYAWANNLI